MTGKAGPNQVVSLGTRVLGQQHRSSWSIPPDEVIQDPRRKTHDFIRRTTSNHRRNSTRTGLTEHGWAGETPQSGAPDGAVDSADGAQQESAPPWGDPDSEAEQLAANIFEAHGGPDWDKVESLAFRFAVEAGGETVFYADHDWDVAAGIDDVTWQDRDQRTWQVAIDLDTQELVDATVDGQPVTDEDQRKEAAENAYGRWINDTYWLLMPIKLFDPGVELTLHDPDEFEGRPVQILELAFDDVGLTPGDRYKVSVDADSFEVVSWEMFLEGADESSVVHWGAYQRFGPLYLPTERHWPDADRRLVLEDVVVDVGD